MTKSVRLEKIRDIIFLKSIASQEELQKELDSIGYSVTQATLSRDLRLLGVVKMPGADGEMYYSIPASDSQIPIPSLPDQMDGVVSIEFSGQFGVLKTLPGFANAVAYFIDKLKLPEIMGTIAGDDTILIIAREGVSKNLLAGTFSKYFKGLRQKILG